MLKARYGVYIMWPLLSSPPKNEEISRKSVGILIPKPYILLVPASSCIRWYVDNKHRKWSRPISNRKYQKPKKVEIITPRPYL